MASTLALEQSRVIPVSVEHAFAGTLPIPLTTIFRHWYGPIPPIKKVHDQVGEWGTVGQTRVVLLTGGGSMHEELTSVDPPRSFGYVLTDVRGPMASLVGRVEGEWTFTSTTTATTVTWRWNIHSRWALTAPLLPVLGRWWKGYARRSLEVLSAELTR